MVETEDGPVDDGTAETEVNFRLPRVSDPGPDLVPKDIPIVTGAVGAEADTPDPGQPRRRGPLGGAKPKRPTDPANSGTRQVAAGYRETAGDRLVCIYEMLTPPTPGPGRLLPGTGTQPVIDMFAFKMPTRHKSKPAAFTSTKVPKFSWVTSWNKYRQVFDAIVWLNGLDNDTPYNSPVGGHIECRPVGFRGKKGHAGRTGRGTK